MTWFKVDDSFDFHPKAVAAGNAALGLWVRAGAYSSRQLTEGFIPTGLLSALDAKPRDAAALVRAGLWTVVDGGYRFHQWEQANPTRAKVLAEREATAERQRRAREKAAQSRRDEARDDDRDEQRESQGRHGPPDPTRPVSTSSGHLPSSSDLPEREDDDGPTTDELLERGAGRLTPAALAVEAAAFRAHNAGRWPELHSWRRAWSGWLTKARERNRPTPTPGTPSCPLHPDQPTGSKTCPRCAAEAAPAPGLRQLVKGHREAS